MQRQDFDAEYIQRLAKGDSETERHFCAYFGELLSIKLRPRLCSDSAADDVKQETFLRVLTALRRKNGVANPRALGAFVNSVCNHVLFEVYRAESKIADPPEDRPSEEASADATLASGQERALVRKVLAEMPEKDRTILNWLFFEERDKDEICRRLGVDREYLRVLAHRARLCFRALYLEQQARDSGRAVTKTFRATQ